MTITYRWVQLTVNPKQVDVPVLERELYQYLDSFMNKLVEFYREYPPPIAGSTYVRTNRLYNSWHVTTSRYSTHLRSIAFNTATDRRSRPRPYMPFVQGIYQTPQHHMTGWLTFTPGNTAYGIQKYFEKDLREIVKRHIDKGKQAAKAARAAASAAAIYSR